MAMDGSQVPGISQESFIKSTCFVSEKNCLKFAIQLKPQKEVNQGDKSRLKRQLGNMFYVSQPPQAPKFLGFQGIMANVFEKKFSNILHPDSLKKH